MSDKVIMNISHPYHHHYHSTGIPDSPSKFTCGPVCLLAELSCFCKVDNPLLQWMLINSTDQLVDNVIFVEGTTPVGTTLTFAEGRFSATVTNLTEMIISSTATGTVDQTTEGYSLHCIDLVMDDVVGATELSIPGKFLLESDTKQTFQTNFLHYVCCTDKPSKLENLTAITDTEAGSVLLSWTPPINSSQCVVNYIITSTIPNSAVSISTTLNHTFLAVGGVIFSCTYAASVAANDTAGRIGDGNQVLFSFSGSSFIISGWSLLLPFQIEKMLIFSMQYMLPKRYM